MVQFFAEHIVPYAEQVYSWLITHSPRILSAFLILFLGWVAARILQRTSSTAFRKLGVDRVLTDKQGTAVSSVASQVVFLVTMLAVLFVFFGYVGLDVVTAPLGSLFDRLLGAFSNVLGAVAVALVAYIVARLARTAMVTLGTRARFDSVFARLGLVTEEGKKTPTAWAGDFLFFVVLLFFLPAVLNLLKIDVLSGSVGLIVDRVLDFAVRLAGSLLILGGAWLVAAIVRPILSGFLSATNIDGLAKSAGLKTEGRSRPSQWIADVVFVLIILFFIPAALSNLSLPTLAEPLADIFSRFFGFLPNVLAAGVLVVVAWIVGRVASGLIERFLSGFRFEALFDRMGFGGAVRNPGELIVKTLGKLVWIVIVLLGGLEALKLLDLTSVADLLLKLVLFVPTILGAVVILGAGFYLARFLSDLVARSAEGLGSIQSRILSRVCYAAIVVLAVGIALEQLSVGVEIVTAVIKIAVAGLAVAFALAVGLGAREFVAESLKEWKKSRK